MRKPLEHLSQQERVDLQNLQNQVIMDIRKERSRQDKKWGVQRHNHNFWLTVLGEEFGEACQAALQGSFSSKQTDQNNFYNELIQVAAVATAIAEQARDENDNFYFVDCGDENE